MTRDELMAKYEKNVAYLQRNIPPDDIYAFAEQTFMAAMFFMWKWSQWEEISEAAKQCEITKKWMTNILSVHELKEQGKDVELDLDLKFVGEEDG